jgi:hypothetical protein
MEPAQALRSISPGNVTHEGGVYRVVHSEQHKPTGEIFLARGLYLPVCKECDVRYALVRRVSHDQHIVEPKHQSCD